MNDELEIAGELLKGLKEAVISFSKDIYPLKGMDLILQTEIHTCIDWDENKLNRLFKELKDWEQVSGEPTFGAQLMEDCFVSLKPETFDFGSQVGIAIDIRLDKYGYRCRHGLSLTEIESWNFAFDYLDKHLKEKYNV